MEFTSTSYFCLQMEQWGRPFTLSPQARTKTCLLSPLYKRWTRTRILCLGTISDSAVSLVTHCRHYQCVLKPIIDLSDVKAPSTIVENKISPSFPFLTPSVGPGSWGRGGRPPACLPWQHYNTCYTLGSCPVSREIYWQGCSLISGYLSRPKTLHLCKKKAAVDTVHLCLSILGPACWEKGLV